MMFYYSWQLSIILIVWHRLFRLRFALYRSVFAISEKHAEHHGAGNHQRRTDAEGHKEVLIFGGQEVETKRFDKVATECVFRG